MLDWVAATLPNVLCIQEMRVQQEVIDPIVHTIRQVYGQAGKTLSAYNEVCKIKGRAGVALLTDLPVQAVRYGLPGLDEPVHTGRWLEADICTENGYIVTVVCVYIHAGDAEDSVKMEQKYDFLDRMMLRLQELQQIAASGGNQAVICGDFNVAHTPLDIKHARANLKHAGFLPEERAYLDRWINECEFVDVVRMLAGPIDGPYTWWGYRGGARVFNNDVGWRIDYQFATPELAEAVRGFEVGKAPLHELRWSDHAPLTVSYLV